MEVQHHRTTLKPIAIALGLAGLGFAMPALADPAQVVITVPPGQKVPANLGTLLASWRQSGQISDVLLLENAQRDNSGFETFVELEFPSENAYAIWQRDEGTKLTAPLVVKRVDVIAHGETYPRDSNHSVFKVNSYIPTVPVAQTKDFAAGYIKPLMEGLRGSKILMRYTMFLERGEGGTNWLVKEYRDPSAFERAPDATTAVRTKLLAENPTYAQFDKAKDGLRKEGPGTLSHYAELPPPQLPELANYKPSTKLTGTLRIYGSELKNAVEYLARGFQQFHPDLRITWSNATSSEGALAGLYTGIADVAPMGDDAKLTDQMPFFNATGYLPTEISVATGGYERRGSLFAWTIVVNKDNPLKSISIDELKDVFGAERTGGWKIIPDNILFTAEYAKSRETNIREWDQLGLGGAFKGKEIQTYGYSAPGFQQAIERHWFAWSHKWNENLKEYVEAKMAVSGPQGDAVKSERPLEILSKDKFGIGIAAQMHVRDYPNLKVLPLSWHKGGTPIPFTPANVANRTYPMIRDAYFYVNKAPGQPLDPKVREFMRFVLSREGQEIIARVGYYYPFDRATAETQAKKLDQ